MEHGLGRRKPFSFDHVAKMPLCALYSSAPQIPVEKSLILPSWHQKHDQGKEGACVGFGTSMMLSILHENLFRLRGDKTPYVRYNPWWLWDEAKRIDPWPETMPGDANGTTVKAACEVLTTTGHCVWDNEDDPKSYGQSDPMFGVGAVRWAQTVDEMRTSINASIPLSIGINWYHDFEKPAFFNAEFWIGRNADLGLMRGGHCTCIYGASDERQAFRMKNSWGPAYPEVWLPYTVMDRLLREQGEASLVTDR